jgi:outer membrane receptor protein involved in Fe transport
LNVSTSRSIPVIFSLALVVCSAGAIAGPPLSIDDPEILDTGTFEVIVAAEIESRDSGDSYLLPILDVSYGLATDLQLAVVATRAVTDPEQGSAKSDFGPAAVGVKWRFLNQDRLQMSVAPYFEFLPRDGAADREVTEDVNDWGLPMEVQYQFDSWRLNGEARYGLVHDAGDEWSYGIAAAYPLSERLEALVEFNGGADYRFRDHGTGFLVGADFAFNDSWHLLASAGSSFDEPGDDDLDFRSYLGLQWFPPAR